MSGKIGSKNQIMLGFACNADGSEKLEIFHQKVEATSLLWKTKS